MRAYRNALIAAALAIASPVLAQQLAIDGKTTFDAVCASCHSIDPPHKTAPPMSHIVRRYRTAFSSDSAGIDAIVRWVQAPARERSQMPAHAVEMFGLMPAFPLPEAQLRDVARYAWTLGVPAASP